MLVGWLILKTDRGKAIASSMIPHADALGQVGAGFAFSMVGFLAAAMSLFAIIGQSRAMRKYRDAGFMAVLLSGIGFTILELSFAFLSSIRLFADPVNAGKITCTLLALCASLGMVLACVLPIIGLQIRASGEKKSSFT